MGFRLGVLYLLRVLRLGFFKLFSLVAAMTGFESIIKVSMDMTP